jgi:hypothetical protein
MSKGHHPSDATSGGGYSSPHMRGVALGVLVIGVSLALVTVLWLTIGYQGPGYSTRAMEDQQARLRDMYGLPAQPEISPELLEVPPSLRNGTSTANTITGDGEDNKTT